MKPSDFHSAASDLTSSRFLLIGYLPTAAASGYFLVLLSAGAPGRLSFKAAWRAAAGLSVVEVLVIAVGTLAVAIVLAPLQLPLVRLLEGGRPARSRSGVARRLQRRRFRALRAEELPAGDRSDRGASFAEVQRAGLAGTRLRRRFPASEDLVRPTALGNVLAAMEDRAGRRYGLDAVVVWPRLYPLLDPPVRAIVDDCRNLLDATARLSVTAAVSAVVSVPLLIRSGPWLLLVVVLAGVAAVAYHAAVQAAFAYNTAVETAFDLCRFNLYRALHLPLPEDTRAERENNEAICLGWRQDVPIQWTYRHVDDQKVDDGGQ